MGEYFMGRVTYAHFTESCGIRRLEVSKSLFQVELCPLPNSYAEALTLSPVPQNVTLFGNRVTTDVIS